MSINDTFMKDFGRRALDFIQSKTKNIDEIRSIQAIFVQNVKHILETPAVDKMIEDAKLQVAAAIAQQLRSEICDRQKLLQDIENKLSAKRNTSITRVSQEYHSTGTIDNPRPSSQIMFDDDDDEVLTRAMQIEENALLHNIDPPDSSEAPRNTSSEDVFHD